ncbi:hypothetical protein [Methylobacterium sp. C1]|uniref:hypothetical protein n=1 Tax=Methylobacterium sp. C1 TaxID=1479019 RepID=UPI001FD8F669|nr:hypothetical protein [Methylobacterium sp. C1]
MPIPSRACPGASSTPPGRLRFSSPTPPGDERYDAVRADLARDPASVPGYRVAA